MNEELETTITESEISDIVQEIFMLTNQEREDAGRRQLTINEKLLHAAQKYAELMANRDELGHAVDGQTVRIRLARVDYRWRSYGENVAYNLRPNAQRVMQQWMGSRGHRENILNSNFKEVGIGVSGPSRRNRIYYCQIFGRLAGAFFKDVTIIEQSSSISAEGGEDSDYSF